MKAPKRLLRAVIALVCSLVLCIGVCLAWFVTNGKVDANDLNSNIKCGNIKEFKIEAYTLTDKTTTVTGGQTITTYKVGELKGNSTVAMSKFGGLEGNAITALLLKFTFTFEENLNKNYEIYADCESTRSEIEEGDTVGGIMHLNCSLSSVIDLFDVSSTGEIEIGTTVTQTTVKQTEEVANTDGSFISLKDGISDSDGLSGTYYCIIDYNEDEVFTQYYKALNIDGTSLSTPMDFFCDIEFYMGESSATV